ADDLVDWRTDLHERVPSMLLRRLIDRWPDAAGEENLTQLGRELYYGGAASAVLDLAIGEMDRFDDALAGIDLPAWRASGAVLRRKLLETRSETERIVRANTERARALPRLDPTPIGGTGIAAELASRALDYLLLQWRRGWGEARHLATFRAEDGFEVERSVQDGDVFQRATTTEALLEVERTYGAALQPLIAAEIDHLHAMRRRDGIGGWSYFPDLPELPPDADDLAQVMLVLVRAGRAGDVAATCDPVLDVLLRDNANDDGSFETWIVPARDRSPGQERQAFYTARAWGTGGDPDVVANLLYALRSYDEPRFAATIERGARFLLRRQHAAGYWESSWYFGPYYGTYVATRFLAGRGDAVAAVVRATAFLLDAQRADGGWGDEHGSDALGTALALLALLYAPHADPPERAAIERGLGYLARHGDAEGGWPAAPFIRLEIGRPSGKPTRIGTYASKTITTAFVAKAAALAEHVGVMRAAS
ncbi:MAG: squalene-hopene/tetraprenyl-beta-curcumene cyclase, partial [Candidatus Eremiobacteraeota bacterium]|nr:squalene-hopene/tetraprenyl-beta-curcumene cyclase [Candidatus Eremiobacteraeota bacterium]